MPNEPKDPVAEAMAAAAGMNIVDPDPVDPVDPTPADPVDPKPADPVDPKPADPVDPKPADPADPVDPKPADPVDPVDPTKTIPTDPKPISGRCYQRRQGADSRASRKLMPHLRKRQLQRSQTNRLQS
jgi:hypothetical protein